MNNYFNNIILYFLTILILHLLIKIYLLEDTKVNFINLREHYNADGDATYNEDTFQYNEDTSRYNENASNTINDYGKDAKYELLTYLDNEKKNTDEELQTLLTKSTTVNKNTIDNSFNNLNKDIYTFDEVPTQNLEKRDGINSNDKNSNNTATDTIQGYDDFDNSYYTL
jgi:hypothetical protein